MKNGFICYVDMDGVLNKFELDKDARINMWIPGYFENIPVREGIADVLTRINQEAHVIILSKVIERIGVTKEKSIWLNKNIPEDAYEDIIYVPYKNKKSEFMYNSYPCMLIDDNEKNLQECETKGRQGLFLSDIKVSQKYQNVKRMSDIWKFYQKIIKNYP